MKTKVRALTKTEEMILERDNNKAGISLRVLVLLENGRIGRDRRVRREIFALKEAGHQVSLICQRGNRKEDNEVPELAGVRIYFYPPNPFESNGLFSYIFEYLYSWLSMFFLSLRANFGPGFDVIHACNPPDIFFPIALFYKLFGKKFVFDQHDLTPELFLSRFSKSNKFVHRVLLFLEKMTYRTANHVIVTNESYKKIAMSRGKLPPEKVFVVRNGPYLENQAEADPDLKMGYRYLVCCMGSFSKQDGIDKAIEAANYLIRVKKRSDIKFVFIGDGSAFKYLKEMTRNLKIDDQVTFTGFIYEQQIISKYLATADVCLSPEPKTELNSHSTFIKVLDYMAAAKPIVAFDLPETRFSAQESALYARPNDIADFATKIEELLEDEVKRRAMGLFGRRRAQEALFWNYSKPSLLRAYQQLRGKKEESD